MRYLKYRIRQWWRGSYHIFHTSSNQDAMGKSIITLLKTLKTQLSTCSIVVTCNTSEFTCKHTQTCSEKTPRWFEAALILCETVLVWDDKLIKVLHPVWSLYALCLYRWRTRTESRDSRTRVSFSVHLIWCEIFILKFSCTNWRWKSCHHHESCTFL